jgi:hypothetical protein
MARSFNGSSDYASATLNLSGVQKATLAFWFWKDAFANDDELLLEHSPNFNSTNGFLVDPNASSGSFEFDLSSPGVGYCVAKVARPSASAWHHYAATFDRTLSSGQVTGIWIDGAAATITYGSNNMTAGSAFVNTTLYVASRGGSSLFGTGRLAELALWSGQLLTAAEIQALALGALPRRVRPTAVPYYWPLWGLSAPAPELDGNANNLTLTGTSPINHAPVTLFTGKARTPCDLAVVTPPLVRVFNLAALGDARATNFNLTAAQAASLNLAAGWAAVGTNFNLGASP